MRRKWTFLGVFLVLAVALDYWAKQWAQANLDYGVTEYAWGRILKLTLSFNRGAAFGVSLGNASRPLFIVFSLVTLTWLMTVFHRTESLHRLRLLGITLVCSGAVGNLVDRVLSERGVVDFLGPYDLRFMLWPIFNIADIYVVFGIALLFLSMRSGGLHEEPTVVGVAEGSHESVLEGIGDEEGRL